MTTKRVARRAPVAATEELSREIAKLRLAFREAVARFQMRHESELSRLEERLKAPKGKKSDWDDFATEGVALIRSTKLRPKRGRLKDLVRVREITQELGKKAPAPSSKR